MRKETNYYPADANAWMWLGVVHLAKEQPEAAAEALDKAAKLDPTNVDILYDRGRAHLLISKDSYDKMFKADPNSWRVRQVLAQADAESDRHTDAIAEYEAAIKLAAASRDCMKSWALNIATPGRWRPRIRSIAKNCKLTLTIIRHVAS